jgi:diguanylate cyclase (GGDEF)-like protein/PAS domain S-box-containing protein
LLSFLLTFFALRQANAEVRRRRAEDRSLAAREEQYRQVIERAGDLIFRTDHLGRFTFCNHATLTTLQLTEQEVMGRSYLKLVRMDWRKQVRSFYLRQFARVHRNTYYEFPVLDGHGRERWLGQNVQLLQEGDRVVGFQGIAREITEHKQAEFESRKRREFVERVAEATPGILYVYDLDEHRNVYCNREIVSVLGHLPEIVKDLCREGGDHFHPDDMPAIRSHHESLRYAQDGEVRRIEYRVHHANGKWVWLASRDTPFERASNGLVKRIVGIAHDVTARKAAQEQLTYLANYDALTGLPNRQHFRTGLQSVLRRAGIEHGVASLCILGVDGFRETNDLFGRAAGDEVLEAVGNIMRSELRPQDLTARWGSHEFCVLLPGTEKEEALLVAERLRSCLGALAFGTASGSGRFSVTATLGVAEWRPNMQPHDLLEAADRAFYRARSSAHRKAFVTAC